MKATLADNETENLKELRQEKSLDTGLQEAFEDFTRLAAQICETPVALINLIDDNCQEFKSKFGLTDTESPNAIAFCTQAILHNKVLVIQDALGDEQFATNPLVISNPHIRFYAGVPLITSEGNLLGTLCAIDYVPRELKPQQLEALQVLSRLVIVQLELRRDLARLEHTTQESNSKDDLCVYFNDITERKRAEDALRQSKDLFRLLAENSTDMISQHTPEGIYLYASPACRTLLGYRPEELIGHWPYEFFHPDDLAEIRKSYLAITKQGELSVSAIGDFPMTNTLTYRIRCKDGHYIWFETTIRTLQDSVTNAVLEIHAVSRDISQRKQVEQKIREQAALLDVTTEAIFVQSLNNQILFWNKGAERLYGWKAKEVLGKDASEFLYGESAPQQYKEIPRRLVEKGEWQGELYKVTKDGKKIIVESRWTLVRDAQGQPKSILVVNTNITEKKQLEAQFFRAQRMESLGTLATGIAHDLNNVLAPILMAVQLLQLKVTDERSGQWLGILEMNAKRGAELVKQVVSFVRGMEGDRTLVQVRHLISEIRQIVIETFPKSIDISLDVQQELWRVCGDATQLHQVLMNLCVNARDAMPDGGTLKISAKNIVLDEDYARINLDAQVGSYIVITVSDRGTGIPPEALERIFEPFFTTKERGQGTGLGLSTVLGIIKSHGGFINVYSEMGRGTEFNVYLPALEEIETPPVENLELPRGHGELILVVDDEGAIRKITQTSLETYGYRVLMASDGIEAIALYAQHKEEISLVLIDMMMPEMDGPTAIRTLRKIEPQVKIVGVSGLVSNDKLAQVATLSVKTFLSKPYTTQELLNTIDGVLSSK